MIAYLFRAKVFECLCNLNLYSLKEKSKEVELFHFISIFLSSAGKVRGRAACARGRGRRLPKELHAGFGGLTLPYLIALPESHDDAGMSEPGVPGMPTHVLVDQVTLINPISTLYQTGRQIMTTAKVLAPPGFSDLPTAL